MPKRINWAASPAAVRTIDQIVKRAEGAGVPLDRQTMVMDLIACHMNGTPLDLKGLLTADEFDFWHDLNGITRHMDRETGELRGCFLPRYARGEEARRGS